MKASETNLRSILEGNKQFIVPLFQRTYSWDTKEWETLWNDLQDLYEEEHPRNHFIGSTVTIPVDSPASGVAKFLLIDGQQRLTTILIVLALLRDQAKSNPESTLAEEITDSFLANRYKKGSDYWKLLPTQADREPFAAIMYEQTTVQQTQIGKAAAFFSKRLTAKNAPDLEVLQVLITSNLMLVDIKLDRDEDPYLIFESLNAKGRPLSQADLIRNYFFMKVQIEEQQHVYDAYWAPMQARLSTDLTEFIRHFLTRDGTLIKQSDVYLALKQRAESKSHAEMVEYLQEIARFSEYYAKLLSPENEHHRALRERLMRLNRLEVTVAYPFLLNIYADYDRARITAGEFADLLDILENFILRRAICGIGRSPLNKVFSSLYAQVQDSPSLVEGITENLSTKNYPKDSEFRERLITARMYGSGALQDRTKLILERIEAFDGNKEVVPFDKLSVEHVMPQTLTPWWREHLGADYEQIHELLLHTLGNLTLTGYNSELSNSDFPTKQKLFAESHIGLNSWFENCAGWNEESIRERAEALADQALKLWPFFGKLQERTIAGNDPGVTGKTPVAVTILGQRIPVITWRDVAQQTLQAIGEIDNEQFAAIAAKYPRLLAMSGQGLRSSRSLSNGYLMETNLSTSDLHKLCIQATEMAGLSSED